MSVPSAAPQTPVSFPTAAGAFQTVDQSRPPKWSTSPDEASPPTAQTSSGPLPHSAVSPALPPLATGCQAPPSQWRNCGFRATATQTSSAPLPQMAPRSSPAPLATDVQAAPFQWNSVPPPPAAQTSSAADPQTPLRNVVVGVTTGDQA